MINPLLLAGAVGLGAFFLLSRKSAPAGSGTLIVPPTVITGPSGSPYPNAGPTYATVNLTGDQIAYIRSEINALGYGPVDTSNLLGPDLVPAIKAFQQANGLQVDGIIGPETWNALSNAGGVVVDQAQTSGYSAGYLAHTAALQAMEGLYA